MKQIKYSLYTLIVFLLLIGCKKNSDVPPVAPTLLSASVVSTSQINLNWTDNSTNETGFKIERKVGTGSYSILATVATDVTSFTDAGLTQGVTYTYRIYAYNSAGKSLSYSNEASATTDDPIAPGLLTGLLAYYPFTGNAGDSSGNGHHGAANGSIAYVNDRNGKTSSAIQLGTGYITVNPNFFQFTYTQSFSVSIWFTLETTATLGRLLSTECPEGNFRIGSYGNGQYAIQFGDATNYIYDNVTLNSWNHLVFTYDNRSAKVYLNGNLKYSKNNTATETLGYCSPFTIGAKASQAFDKWIGKADDLRIYNRVLSAAEVQYLNSH